MPGRERYERLMEVFPLELRRALWTDARFAQPVRLEPSHGGVRGLQLLDIATYLPGDLLLKADIASMAHSLELRSPFLDHEVVSLGLALPDSLKTRGREAKVALRRAFAADLPSEVAGRGGSSRTGCARLPSAQSRRRSSRGNTSISRP